MKIYLFSSFFILMGEPSRGAIPSAREIAEENLRRVADQVVSEVKMMEFSDMEAGNPPERSERITQVIYQVVETVLISAPHRPHFELNQIASCLSQFRAEGSERNLWICLGENLHVLPEALIQMLSPFDFQVLSLARRVGMTPYDMISAQSLVNEKNFHNNFDPIPGNADILRHIRWTEFNEWFYPYTETLRSPFAGLLSFVSLLKNKQGESEGLRKQPWKEEILIEALEVFFPLSPEQIADSEHIRVFDEVFSELSGQGEVLGLENRLRSALDTLKGAITPDSKDPQIQHLLEKISNVNNSEASILVHHRLRRLILHARFSQLKSPRSKLLLEAIVDVCVVIVESVPPSLVPLAAFIDSMHQSIPVLDLDDGSHLIRAAFTLAKRFGIRFLFHYSNVIPPGWSEKKVLSIRKVIGCLIYFNHVSPEIFESYKTFPEFPWSPLALAEDSALAQVASVLSVMNKRLLINWEDAPLFTPYGFLSEFLGSAEDGPSRFGIMISHSLLAPRLPSRTVAKLENLPRMVTDFLQNQPRFDDVYVPLAQRANSLIANLRGQIPLDIVDELSELPELLLGTEVNHWQEPLIRSDMENFVNDLVLPYFDLIEALGGHPGIIYPTKRNGPLLSYIVELILDSQESGNPQELHEVLGRWQEYIKELTAKVVM